MKNKEATYLAKTASVGAMASTDVLPFTSSEFGTVRTTVINGNLVAQNSATKTMFNYNYSEVSA